MKFGAIGALNTCLDFVIFNIVSGILKLSPFGIPTVVFGQICSATILTPFSFFMNRRFTFKSNKRKRDTFVPFVLTNLTTGYIVQTSVIYFVVHILGDQGLSSWWIFAGNQVLFNNFGKCWATAIGMCFNFLSYHFIFKTQTVQSAEEEKNDLN